MTKKWLFALFTASTLLFSACSSEDENTTKEPTEASTEANAEKESATEEATTEEATTEEATTEEPTTEEPATEEPTTEEPTTEEPTEPETEDLSDRVIYQLVQKAQTDDGYITSDIDQLSEIFSDLDIKEKLLTTGEDFMTDREDEENDWVLYHFAMLHQDDLSEQEVEDKSIYYTLLALNESMYMVSFSTSDNGITYDDVLPYCTKGQLVEYWAFGRMSGKTMLLMPIIAGTENNGYYFIVPSLEQMDLNVLDFTIPKKPVGDLYQEDNHQKNTVYYLINDAENTTEGATLLCTVTNYFEFDVFLTGAKALVNGEDVSEGFSSAFSLEANGGVANGPAYLKGCRLSNADELELSYLVTNAETNEELGYLTFVLNLSPAK